MKLVFAIILLLVSRETLASSSTVQKEKKVDIPYIPENCQHGVSITYHNECPGSNTGEPCYHLADIPNSYYPHDLFCMMVDPLQGLEPGVVAYEATVRQHTDYINAGVGMFFNYISSEKYEVVYKIDFTSSTCIVGYVEGGQLYNSTTFNCGTIPYSDWVTFTLTLNDDQVDVTLTTASLTSKRYTFTSHYAMTAKAGPAMLNAYSNSLLHPKDISLQTETCQDRPESNLCDPCTFAYNIQSTPITSLPDYRNYLLWYSRTLELVYTTCYIKVVVDKSSSEVVKVTSHVGDFSYNAADSSEVDIRPGDSYGERQSCTEQKVACVEVKSGGNVTNGVEELEERTKILVTLGSQQGISKLTVNSNLRSIYGEDIVEEAVSGFGMMIREREYGTRFGIYCSSAKASPTEAQQRAYHRCLTGTYKNIVEEEVREDGWAIKFH